MSRASYKVPRWVKKKMENELYQYWDNQKELKELQDDIINSSPEPADGQPRRKCNRQFYRTEGN